jgi:hypothetical protein
MSETKTWKMDRIFDKGQKKTIEQDKKTKIEEERTEDFQF